MLQNLASMWGLKKFYTGQKADHYLMGRAYQILFYGYSPGLPPHAHPSTSCLLTSTPQLGMRQGNERRDSAPYSAKRYADEAAREGGW